MADNKEEAAATGKAAPAVKWDDSAMATAYANVCNVTGTREEVALLFGTNHALHLGESEVTVQLSNRIVLSPYVAKRMQKLLAHIMEQYEASFGELNLNR